MIAVLVSYDLDTGEMLTTPFTEGSNPLRAALDQMDRIKNDFPRCLWAVLRDEEATQAYLGFPVDPLYDGCSRCGSDEIAPDSPCPSCGLLGCECCPKCCALEIGPTD